MFVSLVHVDGLMSSFITVLPILVGSAYAEVLIIGSGCLVKKWNV